jgi:hypothetical protein
MVGLIYTFQKYHKEVSVRTIFFAMILPPWLDFIYYMPNHFKVVIITFDGCSAHDFR